MCPALHMRKWHSQSLCSTGNRARKEMTQLLWNQEWYLQFQVRLIPGMSVVLLYLHKIPRKSNSCYRQGMPPAISANKGCCSRQAISHYFCPWWWAWRELRMETNRPPATKLSASAAVHSSTPWGASGPRKAGHWPELAKAHFRRMISMSPGSSVKQS